MFNSTRRPLKSAVVLAMAFLASGTAAKCQEHETNNLGWAQAFLGAFYPQLKDHQYAMTTTTSQVFDTPVRSFGNLRVQIGDFAPGTVLGAATVVNGVVTPRQPKQFMDAWFTFDKSGHLSTFNCQGPAVGKQEEFDRLKQTVESHDEWTEMQAISALTQAGASYGPKEREKILKLLPLEELEKFFGSVTVISSEFQSLIGGEPSRFALFRWAVTVNIKFRDGTEQPYKMYFEPFKGALIGMESGKR